MPKAELKRSSEKEFFLAAGSTEKEKEREHKKERKIMHHTAVIAWLMSRLQQQLCQKKKIRKKSDIWHSSDWLRSYDMHCGGTVQPSLLLRFVRVLPRHNLFCCDESDESLQVNGSFIESLQNISGVEKLFLVARSSFQVESYVGSTVLEMTLKPFTTMAFMPHLHIYHSKTTERHKYWRKLWSVIAAVLLIKCQRIRKRSMLPSSARSLSNANMQCYAHIVASVPTYSM